MLQQIRERMRGSWSLVLYLFVIIIAVYIYGVVAFAGRFLPGVSVNGHSIALQSPYDVTSTMMSETGRHHVGFRFEDGSLRFLTFSELGVTNADDMSLLHESTGNSWLWPFWWLNQKDYRVQDEFIFSRDKIRACLLHVSWVSGQGSLREDLLRVIPDGDGYRLVNIGGDRYLDVDKLTDATVEALSNGSLDVSVDGCYQSMEDVPVLPAVRAKTKDIKSIQNMHLTIQLDETHQEVIPAEVLRTSVYLDNGDVMIRPSVLLSYLYAVGDVYDTVGKDREFVTSSGETLTIHASDRDTYRGYELDVEQLLMSVMAKVSEGVDASVPAAWKSVGHQLGGQSDFGDTYIEVSLTAQHLWYYEDGHLRLETDVVTGLPRDGRETPEGLFTVRGLYRNYMMYYEDGNASAEYFMHVTPDGVGIHDTYRDMYGGTVYTYAGSHGCINVPYDIAKQLFGYLEALSYSEIPVIIYQ